MEGWALSIEKKRYSPHSRLIHGDFHTPNWDYSHNVVPPMSANSTYRLDSAARGKMGFQEYAHEEEGHSEGGPIFIYDRLEEPTSLMLETRLARAEGAEGALVFASGMAAISAATLTLLQAGQNIVTHPTLYGCTDSLFREWLPRFGMAARRTSLLDLEGVAAAIDKETRVIYAETPLNPTLDLMDLAGLAAVAAAANRGRPEEERVWLVVDNTFMTPWGQRPLEHGADVVVHSLTKGIAGFGTDTAGAVVFPQELHNPLLLARKDMGGMLSPRASWHILTYGICTLPVRFARQSATAGEVAAFLASHPKVESVRYPGLPSFPQADLARRQMRDPEGVFAPGFMVYFNLAGESGRPGAGDRFVDWIAANAYAITLAVSLGNVRTLVESPYNMTHACVPEEAKGAVSLTPGGVRLSVGLESAEDLIADLARALDAL